MTSILKNAIPMSFPDITDLERQAVLAVLNTPSLSMGPKIEEFESKIKQFTGRAYAIGVNSGTAGLHLCMRAAEIEPGDLVVTTPFSFVASTNVILYEKAIPVFVDVDEKTGNINPELVDQAVHDLKEGRNSRKFWLPRKGAESHKELKGIIAVDVFGQPAEMEILESIAASNHVKLIEDSCEALGAEHNGKKAGTFGDFAVFAFYPNKQITTGEGGMVVTDDEQSANLMKALRNQGRAPGDNWLSHTFLGYNYRLDEMSAVLGAVQMTRIDELLRKRQQVADWYAEYLSEIPQVEIPQIRPACTRMSWFVYVIRLHTSLDRTKIAKILASKNIPVRPYFLPIHLQPYMVEQFGYQPGDFPVTEDLGRRGLALPFSGLMRQNQVETVCQELRNSFM